MASLFASIIETLLFKLWKEIFNNEQHKFDSQLETPFIIDAGANIGIATLFFKQKYPSSEILCFEPDPISFLALKNNIEINNISGVELINAALSNKKGKAFFHGQFFFTNPDGRGNSLIKNWGFKSDKDNTIQVQTVKLSSYLHRKVDYLKLDIEGEEQTVLQEISPKLDLVKRLSIEVHETAELKSINSLEGVLKILIEKDFDFEIIDRIDSKLVFEEAKEIKEWVNHSNPKLYVVNAEQKPF